MFLKLVKKGESLDEFDVVFDYTKGKQRSDLKKYQFVEMLDRSEPKELDYVVLQLNEIPAGGRGYNKVKAYLFEKVYEPTLILGHPHGDPLAFSFGVLLSQYSYGGRIAYTPNTAPGSSGSPVFTENWDLVAIHHHGEGNMNNNGIPMRNILKHLKEKNKSHLLTET